MIHRVALIFTLLLILVLPYSSFASNHQIAEAECSTFLFKVAKTHFELCRYEQAKYHYAQLLCFDLTREDFEVALEGWINSCTFCDLPKLAYQRARCQMPFGNPRLLLATTRAALLAGHPYVARQFLQFPTLNCANNLNGHMTKELQDLRYAIYLSTAKLIIANVVRFETDSNLQGSFRESAQFTRRWNACQATRFTLDLVRYQQRDVGHTEGKEVHIEQECRLPACFKTYLGLTFSDYPNWNHVFWNVAGSYCPSDFWDAEVYAYQEAVKSYLAIQEKLAQTNIGICSHFYLASSLRVKANLYHSHFSDQNNRNGLCIEALIIPPCTISWNLMVRYKCFNDSIPFSPAYFDPKSFQEADLLFGLRSKLCRNISGYVQLGPGVQIINDEATTPTFLLESGVIYKANDHLIFKLDVGYTNSNFVSANGYSYRYANFCLEVPI